MGTSAATTTRSFPVFQGGMTQPQFDFIRDLFAQIAEVSPTRQGVLRDAMNAEYAEKSFDRAAASRWITRIKAERDDLRAQKAASADAERRAPLPEVATGRYAVENDKGKLCFYRVVNEAGHYTVFVYASDRQHRIPSWQSVRTILRKIERVGLRVAAKRFSDEREECDMCGRPLTDTESRARGRGPICTEKYGA